MKAADQFHIGIIVDDLDASIAQLSDLFGYEWGMLVDVEQPVHLPAGEVTIPFRFRYSLQEPRLEVIQAQPGTLWTPAVGSGIHHVGYWSDDIRADGAALEAAGYPLEAAGGDGQGNRTWAYHHGAGGPRIELITRALEPMMATLGGAVSDRPVLSAFGAGRSLVQAQEVARQVEDAGFARLWLPESTQPVFSLCSAAALATSSLQLGTGVAVAFARSPMVTAQAAWMLAQATEGRFVAGLGTQVRAHVERRFSAAFAHPGPRMREYIEATRAIYAAFRGDAKLDFAGEFYSFSLLTPMWSPGAMAYPDPPIYVAGVREWMCQMVGEVADGLLVHPMSSIAYLDQVVVPSVRRGEQTAGRSPGTVALVCPVMTAVSDDEQVLERQRDAVRARLAFYGSTPGYGIVFDTSGWPGVGERLNALQREGDFAAMQATITDEMLDALAITSTWDELPGRLLERYDGRADDIVCYSVLDHWSDHPDSLERWQDVNRRFGELSAQQSGP